MMVKQAFSGFHYIGFFGMFMNDVRKRLLLLKIYAVLSVKIVENNDTKFEDLISNPSTAWRN